MFLKNSLANSGDSKVLAGTGSWKALETWRRWAGGCADKASNGLRIELPPKLCRMRLRRRLKNTFAKYSVRVRLAGLPTCVRRLWPPLATPTSASTVLVCLYGSIFYGISTTGTDSRGGDRSRGTASACGFRIAIANNVNTPLRLDTVDEEGHPGVFGCVCVAGGRIYKPRHTTAIWPDGSTRLGLEPTVTTTTTR